MTIKQPSYKIFSFYKKNVGKRVPRYQKAVFRRFGHQVHQVCREDFSHGDFLNHICQTVTDTDILVFFDIDCVPLSKGWLDALLNDLSRPDSIAGAAQTANHLRDGKNIYVSPFFFGISTAYLKKLGYPDMNMTEDMDAGQNLTEAITKAGGKITYWWPTEVEDPQWKLYNAEGTMFGPGTSYNHLVYHAFLSRFDLADRFVKKCKQLLEGTFYGYRLWPF